MIPTIGGSAAGGAADGVALAVSQGSLVDTDGMELIGEIPAGVEFYVRSKSGVDGILLTATSKATAGRVITGVARDDANSRLTPVALAMPSPLVVDFAICVESRRAFVG